MKGPALAGGAHPSGNDHLKFPSEESVREMLNTEHVCGVHGPRGNARVFFLISIEYLAPGRVQET